MCLCCASQQQSMRKIKIKFHSSAAVLSTTTSLHYLLHLLVVLLLLLLPTTSSCATGYSMFSCCLFFLVGNITDSVDNVRNKRKKRKMENTTWSRRLFFLFLEFAFDSMSSHRVCVCVSYKFPLNAIACTVYVLHAPPKLSGFLFLSSVQSFFFLPFGKMTRECGVDIQTKQMVAS